MTHPTDTTPKQQARAALANTIIQKLAKRNMEGYYCPTASEAVQQALSFIPAKSSVSFGGSVTLEESGMLQALREADITLIDRGLARTPQERKEVYLKSAASDFFFMSSNCHRCSIWNRTRSKYCYSCKCCKTSDKHTL